MSTQVPTPWPRRAVLVSCILGLAFVAACGSEALSDDGDPSGDAQQPERVTTLQLDVASTDQDQIEQVTQIVQRRLDALGVTRSDIGWDGSTIEVLVPDGDEQLLRQTLGISGVLEFRPVLSVVGQELTDEDRVTAESRVAALRMQLEIPDDVSAAQIVADEQANEAADAGASSGGSDGGEAATAALNQWGVDVYVPEFAELFKLEGELSAEITPADAVTAGAAVNLVGDGTVYLLGPVVVDGAAVEGATASTTQTGDWTVNPVFEAGADGIDQFNEIAAACYAGDPGTCPSIGSEHGQIGIVLDGVVLSAPSINTPTFERDQIQISGGFDESTATALAAAFDAGASPVSWTLRD